MTYSDYLATAYWKTLRSIVVKRDKNKCRHCRETKGLEVHHSRYRGWYKEKKSDLITLCREHHRLIHKRYYWWERLVLILHKLALITAISLIITILCLTLETKQAKLTPCKTKVVDLLELLATPYKKF